MDNKVANCLRSLASNFSYLADEIEKQQAINNARMDNIEKSTSDNRQALIDVANAILNKLN